MTALKTVAKTTEHVWIKWEPMSVAARLGLRGDIVKRRLPSVPVSSQIPVRMEGRARTTSLISLANVSQDLLVKTAQQMWTIVRAICARTVEHAETASTSTHVSAQQNLPESSVKLSQWLPTSTPRPHRVSSTTASMESAWTSLAAMTMSASVLQATAASAVSISQVSVSCTMSPLLSWSH